LLLYYPQSFFPFINHVLELIFFQGMVIEMVFNNNIQVFSFQFNLHFLKKKIHNCVHY
jgi:hypothetical protein